MCKRQENVLKILDELFLQRKYTQIEKRNDLITALKTDKKIIYIFPKIVEKLNVSEMHNYISILQENNIEHGIILFEGTPTSTVKHIMLNTPALSINIELFPVDDLQFNATKHVLVPLHVKLNKEEAKEFKEKYGTNIPKLLKSDPICRFYDFATGDIIKIFRRDGFISFRIVK